METMKSLWNNWASTVNHFMQAFCLFLMLYFGNSECNWGFSYEEIKNVSLILSLMIVSTTIYCYASFCMIDDRKNGLNHFTYKLIRCNCTIIWLIIIYQYILVGENNYFDKMLIATLICTVVRMCLEKAVEKWNIGVLGQLSIEMLLVIGLLLSSPFYM